MQDIDRGNVARLRLAWAMTMREGSNQDTPLVHDGVMFLTHGAGPLVAAGVIVSGIDGCERYKRGGCFITGHEPPAGNRGARGSAPRCTASR